MWLALAAAALFGTSAPLAKGLLVNASPQLVAGLLYAGSGVGLAIVSIIMARRRKASTAALTRRDWPWLGGAILFGGVMGPVLLMIGLTRTPASAASLLLNLEGVLTALIAWTVFHENVDRRIAIGMALIVIGGIVLSWEGRLAWGGMTGPLAVVAACACWAIDNNFTQKVSASDPVRIAMLKGLIAGAINVMLAIALGARLPAAGQVTATLVLGFFGYGLSLVFFVVALRQLGTARTSAYFSIAPFIGSLVSLVIWREPVSLLLVIAGLCMSAGLFLHFTERHEHVHVHVHQPQEHTHSHGHDEHHQHRHSADDPPAEPHTHAHVHERLDHSHPHYPDIHHRHDHV